VHAVIFDLDGVLLDTEPVWAETRQDVALERGGRWSEAAEQDMKGMSSPEWSAYLRDELGVPGSAEDIAGAVVEAMRTRYEERLPVIDGAGDALTRLGDRWPLGLASSSNRPLIDRVLEVAGWSARFAATVSSEEVGRGKPAPDVYREAARRVGADPHECVAIEDSGPGTRSAAAAGMRVIAIPHPDVPLSMTDVALADTVLASVVQLSVDIVQPLLARAASRRPLARVRVSEQGLDGIPAWGLTFGPKPGPGDSDGGGT
jgi:HAD superfamily hydrolase (TIGR01509 family)